MTANVRRSAMGKGYRGGEVDYLCSIASCPTNPGFLGKATIDTIDCVRPRADHKIG